MAHFRYAGEHVVHFLLQNSSQEYYRTANDLLAHALRNNRTHQDQGILENQYAREFLDIAEKALDEYRQFLYNTIGTQTNFIESFMPEAVPKDIEFGPAFYEATKELCTENGGIDERLSRQESRVRVVQMNYKKADPTSTIPFHIEEQVLDLARLDRRRPFIDVVGGCGRVGSEREDPLRLMSQAVMRAAHKSKANIAVPGTQSGIGTYFGEENVRYLRETEHLPFREKAHMFAVSPGGEVAFPGNPFLDPKNTSSTFALTPVDQIITPFNAGWDLPAKEKRNAPYREHVVYMESLFARMSAGERRVVVVGNGGLFTAMEINEAFKHGFPLFLISDSGRLASVLSRIIESKMAYGKIWSDADLVDMYREVMDVLAHLPSPMAEEFMRKDFGRQEMPETEDYALYREVFYGLLRTILRDCRRTRSVFLEDLEEHLTAYMLAREQNLRQYPGEWL